MTRLLAGLIGASASLSAPAHAAFAQDALQVVTPKGSSLRAGVYTIDLGDADGSGKAWQGPIHITGGEKACDVGDDVAIVTTPIALAQARFLYVSTYSGSVDQLYVVDAKDCSVKWTSPKYSGNAVFSASGFRLPGAGNFHVGGNGLPAK